MNAAAILRAARIRAGLTQRELARQAGIAQPAVSRIERGGVSPRAATLERLLRACGEELVGAERLGAGVDRTLVRERLGLPVAERLRRAMVEWQRTRTFERGRRAR